MQPGKLNRKITVKYNTETQDGSGFPALASATYCSRWASIQPLRGRERFQAAQFEAEVDIRFLLRYDSTTSSITPKMWISYDSRIFDIQAVFDRDEAHREVEILAYEVQ